jgi:hypothetical protein
MEVTLPRTKIFLKSGLRKARKEQTVLLKPVAPRYSDAPIISGASHRGRCARCRLGGPRVSSTGPPRARCRIAPRYRQSPSRSVPSLIPFTDPSSNHSADA